MAATGTRMGVRHDPVEALARVLALEAGPVPKQMYWAEGPPGPACGTNRDLYTRLVGAGGDMNTRWSYRPAPG